MQFYTYILYSKLVDKYYVGYTSDLALRLKKHNEKHGGFTGRANDWELKAYYIFLEKQEAMLFERRIKAQKSRRYIMELIKEFNGGED